MIIIANIFVLIAQVFGFLASTKTKKNDILINQCLFMGLISISSLLLKGYSAVVINVLGIVRNELSIQGIDNKSLNYLLIIASIILGCLFNNNQGIGYLPILANTMQSAVILNDRAQTAHIQLVCGLSSICWTIFNLAIFSYMGALFNLINAVVYFYNFRKNHKDLKLEENKRI